MLLPQYPLKKLVGVLWWHDGGITSEKPQKRFVSKKALITTSGWKTQYIAKDRES